MSAGWQIALGSPDYPAGLRDLEQRPEVAGPAPPRLWGIGDRTLLSDRDQALVVTIVGSRRASVYGVTMAEELGFGLAEAGLLVVSGMANGIDAAAHRGALEAGKSTVAVLAGGPDVPYPASQRDLHRRLVRRGAVVGERRPGTAAPGPWAFAHRNRIMAAMAETTVVVEAAERSGSLISARVAMELGRRVCCVPGRLTASLAAGPHGLIRDGAELIRGVEDVLDGAISIGALSARRPGPALEAELAEVLSLVEQGRSTPDAIASAATLSPSSVAVALVRLELLGYLRCDSIGRYERTSLSARAA
ncbi:MAG: DNA-protecting protein DprA [Solirubrobacterales bacterium]|nr:DNA-protecting protein DprA [Solirubrobacterales bacterium]